MIASSGAAYTPGEDRRWAEALAVGLAALGLSLPETAVQTLRCHRDQVLDAQRTTNLTAIADPEGMAVKHVVDSASGLLTGGFSGGARVVDVGSGAGFPGVVLAVARPALDVVLCEAHARKAAFLERAAAACGLKNVRVAAARAEDLGRQPAHREVYEVAAARAVAPLAVLLELTLPLVRVGGRVVAWKGPEAPAEVAAAGRALQVLGGGPPRTVPVRLPRGAGARVLVVVDKVAPTPGTYPRRPGIPAKRPL